MRKKNILLLVLTFMLCGILSAQDNAMVDGTYSTDKINPGKFNEKLFQEMLITRVNSYLDSLGYEGFEQQDFFTVPATMHAEYMAVKQEATNEEAKTYLVKAGGTGIGAELVSKNTIKVSNEYITYNDLVEQIIARWSAGKNQKVLMGQRFFFAGVGAKVEENGKKVFVSMFIGNYASITPLNLNGDYLGKYNYGGDKNSERDFASLKVPVTTKKYGLKPYDEQYCKRVYRKMPNMWDLQEGLSVNEEGEIIFKYNDLKKFRKFMKGSKDALAVDIIQPEQFMCGSDNNADYSRNNLGYMTKRVWSKNLYKKNLAPGEGKKNKVTKLEVVLGYMPEGLNANDVEMNLMVIKEKSVCANIPRSYVDKKIYDYVPKIGMIPDTVITSGVGEYVPKAIKEKFSFRIMFEQGKYDYKPEEMVDVLATLNEPDFIIDKIFITAYSSLEGSAATNAKLQQQRAKSIVSALEQNQNSSIIDSIITAANLKDLQDALKGTIHDAVCTMTMDEAVAYVNANQKELESFLQDTRYADITIWITYDIEGAKEQKFVVSQFNKAIEAKRLDDALAMQKYILKQVVAGKYTESAVTDMKIPEGYDYVGLNMNKIWLTQFIYMDPIDEDYMKSVGDLYGLDNKNIYVDYNDVLCNVTVKDLYDETAVEKLQQRVDNLYNTTINVDLVDLLNIELQYQVMDLYKDSCGYDHPIVVRCLEKMKEIIKFDKLTWQSSLKFASIFINHSEYEYAIRLLEPWVKEEGVPQILLTTYVTLCSKVEYKVHSNNFVYALERLKAINPSIVCDMFKADRLSQQTFVNTKVKQLYCETCSK